MVAAVVVMVVAACMGVEVECILVAWAAACVPEAWVSQAAGSASQAAGSGSQVAASRVRVLRMQGLPITVGSSITATIALRSLVLVCPTPTPPTTAAGAGRGRHTDRDG